MVHPGGGLPHRLVAHLAGLPRPDRSACWLAGDYRLPQLHLRQWHAPIVQGHTGFWGSRSSSFAFLPAAAYFLWSFCYRQGRTGQSVGKAVMKFKVVSEKTWQPIGFWMSLVRHIANYVNRFTCYVGYLWPLWDNKRQTIADKIMGTVCVPGVQRNAPTPVNASPMTS